VAQISNLAIFQSLRVSCAGALTLFLRLIPITLPTSFVFGVIYESPILFRFVIALHFIVILLEQTLGRLFQHTEIDPISPVTFRGDVGIVHIYALLHLVSFAVLCAYVTVCNVSFINVISLSALFAYSVTPFGASAGHELLHQTTIAARYLSRGVYCALLYPHFPFMHFTLHHDSLMSDVDVQSAKPHQSIHVYLATTFVEGLRLFLSRQLFMDKLLNFPLCFMGLLILSFAIMGRWSSIEFVIMQGLFGFILIETINYLQHTRYASGAEVLSSVDQGDTIQDINYVTRAMLLNLSLHSAHHLRPNAIYCNLLPVAGSSTVNVGYWTSFWVVWLCGSKYKTVKCLGPL
jgi:alkane 1-monooxygenase